MTYDPEYIIPSVDLGHYAFVLRIDAAAVGLGGAAYEYPGGIFPGERDRLWEGFVAIAYSLVSVLLYIDPVPRSARMRSLLRRGQRTLDKLFSNSSHYPI